MLRKVFYTLFFLSAIYLHSAVDGIEADFTVNIVYSESGTISIVTNKTVLQKEFSQEQVQQHINDRPKDVLVGGFIITVTATSSTLYNVISYAAAAFVDDINQFRGLVESSGRACKFSIFGNKTPTGASQGTEMFNDSVIITNTADPSLLTRTLGVNVYVLSSQFADIFASTCFLPFQIRVETI
ncbi:MAG: hypothetical protein S4CHLAM20_15560 [Chlamydiia bacterium]|nr:hypothetical protein [Chlamydiia bacterium]